jgi:hypothetical protein
VGPELANPSQAVLLLQTTELQCDCNLHANILPIKGQCNEDLLGAYRSTTVTLQDDKRVDTPVDTLVFRRLKIETSAARFRTPHHLCSIG